MGSSGKTIIIPDVHQNFYFLEKILEQHRLDEVDRFLFLGDFFDAKDCFFAPVDALEKTLRIVAELIKRCRDKVVLLLGNHDVLYFFNRDGAGHAPETRNELQNYYGIPDRQKITLIRSLELSEFWDLFQIAHYEQGYLCSHAGITLDHWSKRHSLLDNLDKLNRSLGLWLNEKGELSRLYRAGFARGGDMEKGGPLWLDWNREFTEEIGLPQIVGHTVGADVRQMGRSFCMDAQQQCYGILKNGTLEIERI